MSLNGVMAVTLRNLRYFTKFGKPVFQRVDLCMLHGRADFMHASRRGGVQGGPGVRTPPSHRQDDP